MFPVAAPSVPLTSTGSHSHRPSGPEAAASMANRLADESSPYLQQHAESPVDWYPWGPEALDLAKSTDRPILLSIGYSACHWCHVMERESFEDPATAAVMNEVFVSIKVDREERPDIDQIYMKAVQAMTGSGGWPLTAFLTPQGVPYYGGPYFPVGAPPWNAVVHFLEGRAALGGVPTAFVCREYVCRLPVTDAAGLAQQVRALDQGS